MRLENSLRKGFRESVESPEAFSYDFAAVCDGNESAGLGLTDKVSQLYRLTALGDRDDDGFIVVLVSALRMVDGRAAV